MPPGAEFPNQQDHHRSSGNRKGGTGTHTASASLLGRVSSTASGGRTGKSKLLDQLPMPPSSSSPGADEDSQDGTGSGRKAGKIRRKPSVIGKVAASARISEDGSEWGER